MNAKIMVLRLGSLTEKCFLVTISMMSYFVLLFEFSSHCMPIFQVDEIVNISCPLKGRYQNALSGLKRCLKLSMTDGVQRVFGMEYRPIKGLEVLAPAGLKVLESSLSL